MRLRWRQFWIAYRMWLRADCVDMSAAFAYYTLQSLFPALLIALSFASRLLGNDKELALRIVDLVEQILPQSVMPFFSETLERFSRQGFGAGIVGGLLLIMSANNIFLTLQRGADRLWWNRPDDFKALSWTRMVLRFIELRLKALLLLALVGLVLVLDQMISHLRLFGSAFLHDQFIVRLPAGLRSFGSVSASMDVLVSLLMSFLAILVLLWLLPSRRVRMRHLLPGAILASISLTLLNLILGRTLVALGLRFQAYGVVGGVLVLTLWVWLIGVILYYSQCLCVVLSHRERGGRSTLLPT